MAYTPLAPLAPLNARPLDRFYFIFFALHLLSSILFDMQSLYPPALIPRLLKHTLDIYLRWTNDPFMRYVPNMNSPGDPIEWLWMRTLFYFEAFFQNPAFLLGMYAMYNDVKSLYPFLIAYGASGAATVVVCITVILALPSAPLSSSDLAVSPSQRAALVAFYIPFFLVPALIAVDFGIRTTKVLQALEDANEDEDEDRKTR